MKKELEKRLGTSILLFLLLLICIFVNWKIFVVSILLICIISLLEIVNLISIIEKSTTKKKGILFRLISFSYLFFIFFVSMASLYTEGSVFVFYILLICIFSDIGGYVIGKTVGGKKLTKISPKKTISGSVGSFCFSLIPLLLFHNFDQFIYAYNFNNFILCLELSLVCQFGDIFISYIKRKAKVKDTGNFLPGHGGLLDRIDGIIFAIPYAWFSVTGLVNFFGVAISIL